jgi:hypothetical protein
LDVGGIELDGLELKFRVLIKSFHVVFLLVEGVKAGDLGKLADLGGKDSVDIVPADLVTLKPVGDSHKVFSHLNFL